MRKLSNNFFVFLLVSIILMSTAIASSLYSSDSIVLSNGTSVQSALDTLFANNSDCPSGYKCFLLHNTPQVGDYIQMTPTVTSFTTSRTMTGYYYGKKINPSKLKLWRVIKVNNGVVEMIADTPAEEEIQFYGKTGYMNLVGYLNVLASKYENSKYTIGSRCAGYTNQTEYITDDTKLVQTTKPWNYTTDSNRYQIEEEPFGAGDQWSNNTDFNLIKKVYGTVNSIYDYYWASRYYNNVDTSLEMWDFIARVNANSIHADTGFLYYFIHGKYTESSVTAHLRPILVLKANINYVPSAGTLDYPFILD